MRQPAMRAIAAKVTAACGALCLVGAFAMATLLRPLMSLGQALQMVDPAMLSDWERATRSGVPLWLWQHMAMPLLLRPAWLIPVMLGVVLIGAAAQLAWGNRR